MTVIFNRDKRLFRYNLIIMFLYNALYQHYCNVFCIAEERKLLTRSAATSALTSFVAIKSLLMVIGELDESMGNLNEIRRKFISLKMLKDAASGISSPTLGAANGSLSPEKPAEKTARLRELKDLIEETKVFILTVFSEPTLNTPPHSTSVYLPISQLSLSVSESLSNYYVWGTEDSGS